MELPKKKYDVALIGGGIMSATLGVMLHEFAPELSIVLYERLPEVARESSRAWNNAGTGHAAFCELNYTPQMEDGSIDISKAERIVEQFEISKQMWAYLIEKGYIEDPSSFINSVPHMSVVWGEDDRSFLKKRWDRLRQSHLFADMEYSEDVGQLSKWIPLITNGRTEEDLLTATRMDMGVEMNFGALTDQLISYLEDHTEVDVFREYEVGDIDPVDDGTWELEITKKRFDHEVKHYADFVFIGAGGYALPLLDSSDIEESDGYGGFPVSGSWLVCHDEKIVSQHDVKAYTQAEIGAPPMSCPHLDLRIIEGKKALLFGPFAGFSTKFLREGSYLDLPRSIDVDNIGPMLGAWWHNLPLTAYLIEQVTMSKEDRMEQLRKFVVDAKAEDWEYVQAGQRVQIIKKDAAQGGVLRFGTEVVTNASGTIAALLGASPGASTCAHAMITVLEKCFPDQLENQWKSQLLEMIPSYGKKLADHPELTREIRDYTKEKLELSY